MFVHEPQPEIQPADFARRFPILSAHWPGLPPVADARVAHMAELELVLEHDPGARAA